MDGSLRREGRRLNRRSDIVTGLLPLVLVLVVWELVGSPDSPFYPAPSSWWPALFTRGQGEDIIPAIIDTTRTFSLGLFLAMLTGVAVGIGVGVSERTDRAFGPMFEFARALPPAAMVPVATLLLGFDEPMKVVVVVLAAVWPILLNTRTGVRNIDPVRLDMAKSLRLSRRRTVRSVLLPAVTPSVLLGLRVATPVALVITLLVEYLTGVNGVGALVGDAQRTFQPARVYALIVIAGLISLTVNALVRSVEQRARRLHVGR
jgi:ABC-type nitrate/sulfonate/bicarbonate transport system permease component